MAHFDDLIEGLLNGSLTKEQQQELNVLLEDPNYANQLKTKLETELISGRFTPQETSNFEAQILQNIQAGVTQKITPVKKLNWYKYAAAAAVLFAIVTTYFIINKPKPEASVVAKTEIKAPSTNRATITLANGKTVYLDSAGNKELAMQSGVQLTKLEDGKIAYTGQTTSLQYNTLSNPKGSKAINVTLSDGSQIWLNAGSTVTYPIAFIGQERRIIMNGELYYEVAHDANKPFIVQKADMQVQVYGTHFNVKAYDNDPDIKVTLLEGSVSVKNKLQTQMIKPGQQAIVTENIKLVEDADTEQATAWRNGKTSFHSADLSTVLREIERWYDITTEIQGTPPTKSFYADVNRTAPLSDVLKVLDDNNVKYSFDEKTKKLTVMQ